MRSFVSGPHGTCERPSSISVRSGDCPVRLDLNELNGSRIPLEHLNAPSIGSKDFSVESVLRSVADIDCAVRAVPISLEEVAL
jgi:hypothetical protein